MKLYAILLAGLLATAWPPTFSAAEIPAPEMVRIPAGPFLMGSEDGATWEKPVHRVEVSEFWIGRRPVTNSQFRVFRLNHESPGDDSDAAPVTGVTWHEAQEYCRWLSQETGKKFRLPTEAEWEKAARGGLEQKKYPWGDGPPVPEEKLYDEDFRPQPRENGYGMIAGMGLWEWTADWYDPDYYQNSPPKDPQGPPEGDFRVLRGGGYRTDPNSMRCANRGSSRPKASSDIITFRVALDPKRAPRQITEQRTTLPAAGSSAAKGISLTGIDVQQSGDTVIVSLATDAPAQYETMVLRGPDRFVIDLPGAFVRTPGGARSIDVNQHSVKRIRWAQFKQNPPVARVVVDLQQPLKFSVDPQGNQLLIQLAH